MVTAMHIDQTKAVLATNAVAKKYDRDYDRKRPQIGLVSDVKPANFSSKKTIS